MNISINRKTENDKNLHLQDGVVRKSVTMSSLIVSCFCLYELILKLEFRILGFHGESDFDNGFA